LKTILRDMQELRREVNELRAKVQRLEQGWTWA
jgi:polyhydroxyalkanoate synthesis regulator phasin